MTDSFINADWPAPGNVHAFCTTRLGGVSKPPYHQFNLAEHVGDDVQQVARNRALLHDMLRLPDEPAWLTQVHSNRVINLAETQKRAPEADASFSTQRNRVCVVMTADCLPLLVCNRQGDFVAAIHAGWRGLHSEIIRSTVAQYAGSPEELMVWLGPAIGPENYEINEDVYKAFTQLDAAHISAFAPTRPGHWTLDLYAIARQQLRKLGVEAVYGGGFCTFRDNELFYSFRHDAVTGRFASLIWFSS